MEVTTRPPRVVTQTQQLVNRARHVFPGGSVGNIYGDLIIREGRGGHIFDVDGNEYIDFLLGSGPMLLGHAHPEVVEAVHSQIDAGTTFFVTSDQAILLAEQIVEAVPCAELVRFTSSGTEATHMAMRVARAFRKRDRILKFEGAFHGSGDYALMSMAPKDPPAFPAAAPDSPGIPTSISEHMLIAPFNDSEVTRAIIEEHHDQMAGVMVEPIQRLIPPEPGFLSFLREVTEKYQIPLIFDEVVTGFRFAYGGAQEYYGVVPDLCAMAKAVGGGYPLAVVAGRAELMRHFDPAVGDDDKFVPQIGTLNGNPVAATAGLATLAVLRRKGTYENLFALGRQLMEGLERSLRDVGLRAQVVGEPPMFDVYFTDEPIRDYRSTLLADKQMLVRFNSLLLEQGVLKGDLKFYVSTAHTQEDVEFAMDAFKHVATILAGRGR